MLGALGAILTGSASWESAFITACGGLAGLYFFLSIGAAFLIARRDGWRFLAVLPIVFATYHLAYGLGFVLGLAYSPMTVDGHSRLRQAIMEITR